MTSNTQAAGKPIHFGDCAIAAITIRRGFVLATRNVRHDRYTAQESNNQGKETTC